MSYPLTLGVKISTLDVDVVKTHYKVNDFNPLRINEDEKIRVF